MSKIKKFTVIIEKNCILFLSPDCTPIKIVINVI